MSKTNKQIILLTIIGIVLSLVAGGITSTVIPLAIGLMALAGETLYQKECEGK